MNVLVINCGSSSLKYQLIDSETCLLYTSTQIKEITTAESFDELNAD